ncbi:MAG: hypothetical protein JXD23_17360 [Spirochaetales bacterium]|nr:hypothetical protein [Spirochaetales bacterium]
MDKAFTVRWNIIGFAGGGAFFLSFLLGILSGNPFFTILLRAFIFGIVFALLGGGAAFLVDRFIPQISGGEEEGADTGRRTGQGSNVNIVLEGKRSVGEDSIEELTLDENEPARRESGERDAFGASADETYAGVDDSSLGSLDDDVSQASSIGADFAEDLISPEQPSSYPGDGTNEDEKTRNDEIGFAAQSTAQEKTADGPAGMEREKSLAEGDLDVLPDMSSFESSFSPVTSSGMVTDTDSFENFGTDSLKKSDMDQDPESYVKAVRTILKRDEGKK